MSVWGTKVVRESLHDTIKYPARVMSTVEATILSEMEGVVRRIDVQLGQSVRKGQTLLEVIQTDPIYQFRPFRVTAPVSGTLGSIEISVGSRIARGQKLAFVMDPTKIRAQIEVVADHVDLLPVGTRGTFLVSASNGEAKPIAVTLKGVSPMVDSVLGTALAQLEFELPKASGAAGLPGWLRPGRVGQVVFEIHPRQAFKIKEESLTFEAEQPMVRIVEDGKVRRIKVVLGKKSNGWVEVAEGLSDGMFLVERASGYVKDGQAVTVQ